LFFIQAMIRFFEIRPRSSLVPSISQFLW